MAAPGSAVAGDQLVPDVLFAVVVAPGTVATNFDVPSVPMFHAAVLGMARRVHVVPSVEV